MSHNVIELKTAEEIELLALGGEKLAAIRDTVAFHAEPGVTTAELEAIAVEMIKKSGGESTFKGFHGYPAVSCISINDEVVHGIPGSRKIEEGDLVGIDIGLRYKGFCTDSAVTVAVGRVSDKAKKLIKVTEDAFYAGLDEVKPGNRIGDIGEAIQRAIEKHGMGVVRDLTGHGIGRQPHEEPPVPNFGKAGTGPILKEGMVLAIEPMVTLGNPAVRQLADGWTIVTLDGSLAAHYEHTVAVTADGYRVLT